MPVTGGCLCGSVRYEMAGEPIITRLCWCRFCQYIATGNAAVSVCFETRGMKVTGETRDFTSIADSGNVMHRRFCPRCGTHLFSEAEVRPHLVFVRAGTLDDPELAKPAAVIWTAEAPSWACIDESLPQWKGQPPPVA
ncbi:GFA family protein [Aestuariivirga sp.]|uniref:GFA family protein n=1 Tax=Aestuariivirga sp. TaxID=2650926 RepID=UPI0039E557ED